MIVTSWDFEAGGKSKGEKTTRFNLIRSSEKWIEIA